MEAYGGREGLGYGLSWELVLTLNYRTPAFSLLDLLGTSATHSYTGLWTLTTPLALTGPCLPLPYLLSPFLPHQSLQMGFQREYRRGDRKSGREEIDLFDWEPKKGLTASVPI